MDSTIEIWVLGHFKVISLKGNLGKGIDTNWTTPMSEGKIDLKMEDDKPLCRDELDFALDVSLRVIAWKRIHVALPTRQIADFPYKRGDQCKYDPSTDPASQTTAPPSLATAGNTATS